MGCIRKVFKTLFLFLILQQLYAHPLNTTNIELYLNKPHPSLDLRFYIFNLKPLLMINGDLTPTLITKKKQDIVKYIQESITVKNTQSRCKLIPNKFLVENQIALQTSFQVKCQEPLQTLSMHYTLFFEFDKTQEGVMQILTPNDEKLFIFSPHQRNYTLHLQSTLQTHNFQRFIIEGVWHIWEGIDHMLFLLMLLLPSVLIKHSFKEVLLDVLKIVTAFTLSHSLTLSLSMFNILNPPEQLIETLIALSILLTALNNIYPLINYKREWLLAFLFGFIHGFGFANALHEMELNSTHFASAVFGFNIGVEVGQVVIVAFLLPLLYKLARKRFYKKLFVPSLSLLVAFIALLWAIDRAFALRFMPF